MLSAICNVRVPEITALLLLGDDNELERLWSHAGDTALLDADVATLVSPMSSERLLLALRHHSNADGQRFAAATLNSILNARAMKTTCHFDWPSVVAGARNGDYLAARM